MAYDRARNRTVLYGGGRRRDDKSVWQWDGVQWAEIKRASTSPGHRWQRVATNEGFAAYAAARYDSSRGACLALCHNSELRVPG